MVRAKLFRQRLLFCAACDSDDLEAHLGRELDAEVAQPADAEDCDDIARPRDRLPQGIERRDARTHQRGGVDIGEVVGDAGERFGGRDHVLGVTAVVSDARYLSVLA